jgi:peptide-methionine (S)-S-oxide reductase
MLSINRKEIKKRSIHMSTNLQTATLAGGCFWCLEAVYDEIKGVHSVESGYAGGHTDNPSYRDVCNGDTGHAEVVQVHFDPSVVSYRDLLNVFFAIHDPTTLNRQGADVGTQYRSAIFYHDEEQKKIAEELIKDLNTQQIWDRPIVTQVEKLDTFYMAEDYHQEYFARNPYQPYCMAVVAPKVSKFRKHFLELLKKQTV